MQSIEITYKGVPMEIEYEAYQADYGVEGSPEWDECEINGVLIGGIEVIEMLTDTQVEEIGDKVLEAIND